MKRFNKRNFVDNVQPILKMGRSKFDLSYSYKTSMNTGDLCPVFIQEVYPGDTFKHKSTFVFRTLSPFIRPVMDNLFLDMYYFFVPNRLVYDRWNELMGENVSGYWKSSTEVEVPGVFLPLANANGGPAIEPDTIAAYFGLNIGEGRQAGSGGNSATISDIPFRAFALIYNEWFRNENFEAPVYIETGDYSGVAPTLNNNAFGVDNFHGKVPKVNKLADYFTSCLPQPQKGDAVDIPIGNAPVISSQLQDNTEVLNDDANASMPLSFAGGGGPWSSIQSANVLFGANSGLLSTMTDSNGGVLSAGDYLAPNNLVALNSLSVGNINDLRFAFQLQKLLEKDARGGTRYVEYLSTHFGVISPDARLQRPEFLGGKRVPLEMKEVAQTSQSTETSPLAQLSAFSTTINQSGFSKGFVEHGFIIGVACVRQRHTYQQGIERFWMRRQRYDFYDPVFANIGEQPVYKSEIYAADLVEGNEDTIFGYNEAWADLRYRPSRITGILNSVNQSGFDIWHFGDYYANAPTLNNQFMKETSAFVDRTLSVSSDTAPNFICDFYFKNIAARVMPLYSIPGLVDHH